MWVRACALTHIFVFFLNLVKGFDYVDQETLWVVVLLI